MAHSDKLSPLSPLAEIRSDKSLSATQGAACPVDAPDDDDDCFFLGWLFPKPAPPSLELPGRRRNRKPKYAKVATTPSAGGFAIADDSSDSDGDMV